MHYIHEQADMNAGPCVPVAVYSVHSVDACVQMSMFEIYFLT